MLLHLALLGFWSLNLGPHSCVASAYPLPSSYLSLFIVSPSSVERQNVTTGRDLDLEWIENILFLSEQPFSLVP